MKMNNEKVAKLLARKVYASTSTEGDFALQLFVEEICVPKEMTGYTEDQMEDCILLELGRRNISIDIK